MNPAVLTPDSLFPFKGSPSCSSLDSSEDSLTPYKLSLLVLIAEYFEYREKAAANQNGYRTLLKGLKLLSTNAAAGGGGGSANIPVDRDESYVPPTSKDPSAMMESSVQMGEDDDDNGPKDSKPAKRKVDDPEAAVDAAAAAAAAAASNSDDASAAFLSEKNKCDFALLLLSLLQTGEMEFKTLLAKVNKISTRQFCHLYKRRMISLLQGGVHALFDFRETGVEALLQESSSSDSYSIHKSSFLGLFLRRLNLAFKTAKFPQIVSLYESTVAYVDQCLSLDSGTKTPKPYGLWPAKKTPTIKFQDPNLTEEADEEDADITFAAKSTVGDEMMQLEDSLLDEKLKPKHISTPFVGANARKVVWFDDDEDDSVESRMRDVIDGASALPIPLTDWTSLGGDAPLSADEASIGAKQGGGGGVNGIHVGSLSQKQVEYFIATQVNLLVHNETKALAPKPLQACINHLVSWNPDLAALHYLSFLNAVRCNEFNAALHSLHHYFDRQHPKGFQSSNSRNAANDGTTRGPDSHLINPKNYRYGALNLAALHHRFSQSGEALSALHEAIQMAQEAGDAICLQYALGWLHLITEQVDGEVSNDPSSLAEIITRGIKKSNELLLPFLSSLGIQSLARQLALSSDSTKPHHIFEGISRSDVINCQHSMVGLMATSFAEKAALWRMYGNTKMASLASQALLQLNSLKYGVPQLGSPEVLALVYLAESHASKGHFELADTFFSFLSFVFPVGTPNSVDWLRAKHRVDFAKAVGVADLDEAAAAQSSLIALDEIEGALLEGLLLSERSLYSSASDRLLALSAVLNEGSIRHGEEGVERPSSTPSPSTSSSSAARLREQRHHLHAVVLLAIGQVFCQMGNAPQAIQYLLKALTFSEARHHDYRATEAKILLALTQYQLQMPSQALAVIEENMASVMTHGPPSFQAKTLFLRARCHVATSAKYGDDVAKRTDSFRRALLDAYRARALFQSAGDFMRLRQTLVLISRLHHHLGEKEARNSNAKQFRLLESRCPKLTSAAANVYRIF